MKKTLLTVLACSAILLSFMSCKPSAEPEPEPIPVVDLRNKDADGKSLRAAANAEPEFSYKLLEKSDWASFEENTRVSFCTIGGNSFGPGTDEYKKMAAAIKFEDCEDGVKFVFTKPEGYDNVTSIVFQYMDGNGQRSTCIDSDDWNSVFNGNGGNFELTYPLVLPGKRADFWVMLGNGNENQLSVNFKYTVMPAHGKGIVDDLPKNYDETNYVEIDEDGHTLKLKKIVPPTGVTLMHCIEFDEQTGGSSAWGYDTVGGEKRYYTVNKLGNCYEEALPEEQAAALAEDKEGIDLTIDLNNYLNKANGFDMTKSKNYDYFFIGYAYIYRMTDEKFASFRFASPQMKSLPVKNTFKTAE